MAQEWEIRGRTAQCAVTNRPFADGEVFYTLLFRTKQGFDRQDLCEEAWNNRPAEPVPFSFWKSKFEEPTPPPPDTLPKESAEDLLRRFMEEDKPEHLRARYILALMLERKRILRPVDVRDTEDGSRLLIYEHAKTGEVFIITDPELRLDQIEEVQMEVADLLQ